MDSGHDTIGPALAGVLEHELYRQKTGDLVILIWPSLQRDHMSLTRSRHQL